MRSVISLFALLVLWAGLASADDPPDAPAPTPTPVDEPPAQDAPPAPTTPTPTPTPTPTTTPTTTRTGPTIVTGRVIDVLGKPVSNARVYVLPRAGKPHTSKTDKNGRYSLQVQTLGTHGVVIAIDKAHTFRTVLVQQGATNTLDIDVELDTSGGEVIKIEDKKRPVPTVKAKPVKDPRLSLPYSDEAVERDAWARAWMLLDVDERGTVTRLKLLKRPGFDLDKICIDQAFTLTFEPALDHAGRPMKTYMLWTMEWPSWGWLIQGNGVAVRRPADSNDLHSHAGNRGGREASGTDMVWGIDRPIGGLWARPNATATAFQGALDRVPCAGSGPLNLDLRNRAYRDCSPPDLGVVEALPWITRETAATAIAELANPRLLLDEGYDPGSPWPGYIGAAVSGVFAVATVLTYREYSKRSDAVSEPYLATIDPLGYIEKKKTQERWRNITLGCTAAMVVSIGVTTLIWNRNQRRSSFSVQPTEHGSGAAATYLTKW